MKKNLKVGIVMGSDSDLPSLMPAIKYLKKKKLPVNVEIVSAHRTPEKMFRFAKNARRNGFGVIIAAAGGAAHLPGMLAALSELPVIGVPVKIGKLDGIDSLLSIAQMPKGVPVITVGINQSLMAAKTAAQIIC